MPNKIIRELSTYILEVGESITSDEGLVYILRNKDTGVIETETRILPQALGYIEQLQGALDAMNDMNKEEAAKVRFDLDAYKH